MRRGWPLVVIAGTAVLATGPAEAHGIVGDRFFPATIATDDPFVADEASLPTVATRTLPAGGDQPATREVAVSAEWSKRITPHTDIEVADSYLMHLPKGGQRNWGWDNLEVGAKAELFRDEPGEAVASAALAVDVGRTGTGRIGADPFTTVTPELLAGKGLGGLPDSLKWLRPLAVTGVLGLAVPLEAETRTRSVDPDTGALTVDTELHPTVLQWGGAIEYSLPYLQSQVRDFGLPDAVGRLVPLVEVALQTSLNRGQSGVTTGTVNTGLIWAGRFAQFAVEAEIPINTASGHGVGAVAQVHLYLDDLFPRSLGRPLSEW